ncbi:MAG TPA: stage III sporulation protein AG [Candidatus Mediterraneibacter intestinigallinarum]|nr:stage III sporulation protein AG [Candidatus Mediterraneibacter intestinigallinarum]
MGVNKLKEWLQGLWAGEKLPKKNHLLIMFLVGMLLFVAVFPFPSADRTEDVQSEGGMASISQDGGTPGEYESYLEERTADILRQVDGVGEVTVMITLKSGSQKIIEKDQSSTTQTTEEEDSAGGTRSVEDSSSDKTSIYEQNSDGSSTPYVSKELTPEIEGVVVIADGGDNAVVVESITEAVQALFGVEAHKIKIMKRA